MNTYAKTTVIEKAKADLQVCKTILTVLKKAEAVADKFDGKIVNARFYNALTGIEGGVVASAGVVAGSFELYAHKARRFSGVEHFTYANQDTAYIRNYDTLSEDGRLNAENFKKSLAHTAETFQSIQKNAKKVVKNYDALLKKYARIEEKKKELESQYYSLPSGFRKAHKF